MDVFDLVAKIRLDSSEYESGVGKAQGTFSNLASGVKNGLATVSKIGAAAVSAGVAGVAALTKMGIEGYKQYEQLSGGAKLLWGEAYDFVADKAAGAYATVQMSQNDYLQQVNGLSVGLKVALGGNAQAAAELAHNVIQAEADIIAATGATQENVQNAFNGIMKSNFSMVDNLGLGITATKEGFQTMIDSVNAYNAAHGKSTQYTIDNVADCQAALVDYVAMQGMAGYAGMEAANSIEGSVAMMKGAWENLVVGMADDNSNMVVLINNFVESASIAAKQLLPRIEQTLVGIADLITALSPVIAEALPVLVESVLPSLLTSGVSLITAIVKGVVSALPALYTALLEAVQIILVEVFGVSEEKAGEFADGINSFFKSIKDGFVALVESAQTEGTLLNDIWTGLQEAFGAVKDMLVAAFDAVVTAFNWLVDQINTDGTYLNLVWENLKAVCTAVWGHIQNTFTTVVNIITNIFKVFTSVLKGDWSGAWEAIKNIVTTYWDYIKETFSIAVDLIKNLVGNTWDYIKTNTTKAWNSVKSKISSVWTSIKTAVSDAISSVKSTVSSVWNSIKSSTSNVWDGIKSTVSNVWSGIKSTISTAISNVKSSISSGLNGAFTTVSNILGNIKTKFSGIFDNCKKIVTDAISAVKKVFNFEWSLPKLKLPHISVQGGEAPYGIGGEGHLPRFSISWYAKAMDNAMVLTKPTIFGFSPSTNQFLGGGEAGNEVVAGESYLLNLIGHAVESKTAAANAKVVALLGAILETMTNGNEDMIRALMADKTFAVGEREFARLVKTYA